MNEHSAQILSLAAELVLQLETALKRQALIDRAIGVLLARGVDNAESATAWMRVMSQDEASNLVTVAQRIVEDGGRQRRPDAK